jgi:succinyl-CoA synthetase beta subunit
VLCEWKARPLLATYGIDTGQLGELTHSAAQAECAARRIGKPVALKVQSAGIMHKTEAGCVAINVEAGSVGTAFDRLMANANRCAPSDHIDGVLVQPMAPAGREVILGVNRDATWGPLLMVGLGGVLVEALADVALAPVPLDHEAALTMLSRLKGAKLLGSYQGAPPADVDALVELMVRLSHFAADYADDIAEIDLNPVIVHAEGQGVSIVDALIIRQSRAVECSVAE